MFSKLFTLFLLFYSCAQGQILENINGYYGDKWTGLIPHLQPFNTSDYYGSGDVNCDTRVDSKDIEAIQLILKGESNPNIRADVNGDHSITEADLQMLNGAISGDTLPAWWNFYNDRNKKINWLKLMLKIDKTDEHAYVPGEYVCSHFASQLFKNFTGMNEFSGIKNTFQTIYNLPVYYIFINPPSQTAHNLNAVLIGEDPLKFNNWLFIEPQNDAFVDLKSYPAGTQISFMSFPNSPILTFELNSYKEAMLQFHNNNLITNKPINIPDLVSQPYISNPYIIANNRIIFERATDDMERRGRLHIAALDNFNSCSAKPLTMNSSSIILIQSTQTGGTDLIWEESVNDTVYEYYYGNINQANDELNNIQKLPFLREKEFYRLEMYNKGLKGYIIWLSYAPNTMYKYNISEMVDGIWQTPKMIEMGKSNYPTEYELGEGADGNIYLFSMIHYPLFNKILTYSSDKNWENPSVKEFSTIDKVFYLDHQFIVAETKMTYRSNYIGIFEKTESDWNIINGYFTGSAFQVLSKETRDKCYYITGVVSSFEDRFICAARMENSKPAENYLFRDHLVGSNVRLNSLINNNELIIIWQDGPSKGLNIIKQNLETSGINTNTEIAGSLLNQNYPNPFNSETIIKYKIEKFGSVDLKIYDILGREVKTVLNNSWETAGEHSISFNGKELSSGIYFYKLTTEAGSLVKTMMLVK